MMIVALVLVVAFRYLIVGALMSAVTPWFPPVMAQVRTVLILCIGLLIDLKATVFFRNALLRNFRTLASTIRK